MITSNLNRFIDNIIKIFSGRRLYIHLTFILLTLLIVKTDFDWIYFTYTQSSFIQKLLFPAVIIGAFLPILLPLILFLFKKTKETAFALAQSGMTAWLVSSLYKAFTGRIPPQTYDLLTDTSHGFRLGFMKGGIFWGWPSSHTTVAFSMAVTLIILYPKNRLLKIVALVYAFYIGIGISVSIHWFSEFIAGAILGSLIGIVVGKSFKKK